MIFFMNNMHSNFLDHNIYIYREINVYLTTIITLIAGCHGKLYTNDQKKEKQVVFTASYMRLYNFINVILDFVTYTIGNKVGKVNC
jgi:hypothetical protein